MNKQASVIQLLKSEIDILLTPLVNKRFERQIVQVTHKLSSIIKHVTRPRNIALAIKKNVIEDPFSRRKLK